MTPLLGTASALALSLLLTAGATSCSDDDPLTPVPDIVAPPGAGEGTEDGNASDTLQTEDPMTPHLTLTIGRTTFDVTLEDNDAARAFAALLPLTVDMQELNGNEKYHYLDESLPTSSSRPGTIRTGDLMLYGSTCVVLFYETFTSGYSYTRLGRISHPEGLAEAVGRGNVRITFEKR